MTDDGLDLMARTGDEREVLLGFHAAHRRYLRETIMQLTDDEARLSLAPSLTTPMGLLKHAAFVETAWFACRFGGVSREDAGIPTNVDDSFRLADADSLDELIQRHRDACSQAGTVIEGIALDDTCDHPTMGTLTLRWVSVHCIRELAQHTGHADILVEQIRAQR